MMGFEGFQHIYGEPKAEWTKNSDSSSPPFRRFLMHIFAPDYNHIKVHVTDFRSNTFGAVKTIMQLEDMRDIIGIGGSWSEFVEYMIASLKSEDVKLVVEKHSSSDGPACANLVAQKSKGMPLISISLTKLVDSAVNDAIEDMSFGLFESLKSMQNLILQERDSCSQLTKLRSVEKDSRGTPQNQSEKRQRFEKVNSSIESGALSRLSSNGLQDSPDKQSTRDPVSNKVKTRGVPAYRRAKARGAILQDIEEDEDN
ncbi:uncharacterized protein [Euphorbia lathyris]|uniref:uncharacterized protein n=1 Tax=Euphorbia lathyris TaxID=212925 RepID=UPI0033134BD0